MRKKGDSLWCSRSNNPGWALGSRGQASDRGHYYAAVAASGKPEETVSGRA